jgi:hypothetical protein
MFTDALFQEPRLDAAEAKRRADAAEQEWSDKFRAAVTKLTQARKSPDYKPRKAITSLMQSEYPGSNSNQEFQAALNQWAEKTFGESLLFGWFDRGAMVSFMPRKDPPQHPISSEAARRERLRQRYERLVQSPAWGTAFRDKWFVDHVGVLVPRRLWEITDGKTFIAADTGKPRQIQEYRRKYSVTVGDQRFYVGPVVRASPVVMG